MAIEEHEACIIIGELDGGGTFICRHALHPSLRLDCLDVTVRALLESVLTSEEHDEAAK